MCVHACVRMPLQAKGVRSWSQSYRHCIDMGAGNPAQDLYNRGVHSYIICISVHTNH